MVTALESKPFDVKYIPFGRYYILGLGQVVFVIVFSWDKCQLERGLYLVVMSDV